MDERVVARITRGHFGDIATRDRMVIAPSDQRGSGRRAKRGRVIHVVAEAAVCDPLEIWGWDWATKGAARSEAHVIGQDQQDVRRSRWSL
jgi:hypothetical protein